MQIWSTTILSTKYECFAIYNNFDSMPAHAEEGNV